MRASSFVAVAMLALVVAACDGSTAPASCDRQATSAQYVHQGALLSDAMITAIKLKSGSAVGATNSRTEIDFASRSDPTVKGLLFVDDATAIFTQRGSGAPQPASACALAIGQTIADYGTGFGDVVTLPDDPMPAATQIVIER